MREIVPLQSLVYLSGKTFSVDCSPLVEDNITYVGEDDSGLWIERDPFEGRVRSFSASAINAVFSQAQAMESEGSSTEPESLEHAKARRKSDVDILRDEHIAAGMAYNFPEGVGTIQLRKDRDISNVQGVASAGQALMAMGDTTTTISFRDSEDVTHQMAGSDLVQMGLAVASFISNHYSAAWDHKDAIDAAAIMTDVNSYDINAGWPE